MSEKKMAAAELSDALRLIPEQYQERVCDFLLNSISAASIVIAATQTNAG